MKKRIKKLDEALDALFYESKKFNMTIEEEIHSDAIENIVALFDKLKLDIHKVQMDNAENEEFHARIERERKMELQALKQNYDISTQPPMFRTVVGTAE